MAQFDVRGPFPVATTVKWNYRKVAPDNVKTFWKDNPDMRNERGCYLFALSYGEGYRPVYAGKATRNFKQEAFERKHKIPKYNKALKKQGAPVIFFVCLRKTRGRISINAIDGAESFLIQAALLVNNDLLNNKKTKVESWSINGILRSGRGKTSVAAGELSKCLHL